MAGVDVPAWLEEVDKAASPGPWEAVPDFPTTLERLAASSPSLSVIPLAAPALPVDKGYGVGWIRTEANAQASTVGRAALPVLADALRALEGALCECSGGFIETIRKADGTVETKPGRHYICARCAVLDQAAKLHAEHQPAALGKEE
jgi:hypothetical protein